MQGLLTLAVCVVVIVALYVGRDVLIPITLAVLLSFVLAPLVRLLKRTHAGRTPSVLLAVLLALGVIVALGSLIASQVADFAGDVPRYAPTIQRKFDTLRGATLGEVSDLAKRLGAQVEQAGRTTVEAVGAHPGPTKPSPMPVEVHQPDPTPLQVAESLLAPILSPLATLGVVFIVAIFILLQQEDLRDRLIRLFGSRDLHRTTAALDDAARRLSRYFLMQLAINTSFGVVITLGLLAIGVPNPILWGIFASLLRFVPYVGTFISGSLPALLAGAVDPGWSMLIWTVGLFVTAEVIAGQVVEPILYGHSAGLSPLSVIVAAIFWTWIWGPIGLILSMPLTLCLVVLGRHIERLEFLDVLLGDQPALTPVESFYQRMLAGDSDEALHQAETLLKRVSLSAYYDDVALPGLHMAEVDTARGVLTQEQVFRIKEGVEDLVNDLADYADALPDLDAAPVSPPASSVVSGEAPPPVPVLPEHWLTEPNVLCLAGRGALDEAACAMVSHVFGKNGLGTRILPHDQSTRSGIAEIDADGVTLACVSFLEPGSSPSVLRYMVRRLRRRLPGVPVLIGLWGADRSLVLDERLRAMIDADHYATTLREALSVALDIARRAEPTPVEPGGLIVPADIAAGAGEGWVTA